MAFSQENDCERVNFRKTAKFLKSKNNFKIITHSSPDGDTLGSAFALYYVLKQMNKTACVVCSDEIPSKYDYFTCETDRVDDDAATLIAVDVATETLFGNLFEQYKGKTELCIDHHISNDFYAKKLLLNTDAAATCEIIFGLFKFLKVDITEKIAKALYTGIATDTGCFKYQNVTENTLKTAAELYRYNIGAADINKLMFDTKSKNLLTLEKMVLDTAEYHFNDKCMLLSVTKEMQQATGCTGPDLEGIAVISRSVQGVICGITVKQLDDETFKISMRTYAPLNAFEICKNLGGGGHNAAAGATIKGTLQEVKKSVLAAVEKAMEESNAGISAGQ